jgi:hypothetical protein
MKTLRIEKYSFGTLVINGKTYTDDLIILPDGKILKPWWRKQGHKLIQDDLRDLIDSSPEVIVAGTGVSGNMTPENNLVKDLSRLAIELIAEPNDKAMEIYNKMGPEKRVGACFHLTC